MNDDRAIKPDRYAYWWFVNDGTVEPLPVELEPHKGGLCSLDMWDHPTLASDLRGTFIGKAVPPISLKAAGIVRREDEEGATYYFAKGQSPLRVGRKVTPEMLEYIAADLRRQALPPDIRTDDAKWLARSKVINDIKKGAE